jgi:hypothetical protein
LADFQNTDGGYGHALEPDLRLPTSSVIATTVAFQRLREAGADDGWPEVQRAVGYLVSAWDPTIPGWEPAPPSVDDHPHAPWWSYPGPPAAYPANPGAEAFAVLLRHRGLVSPGVLEEVAAATERAVDVLGEEVEPHEMLCWLRLAEEAPPDLAARILAAMRRALPAALVVDAAAWDRYVPGPLWFAPTPGSPLAADVAGHVEDHLDHLVSMRQSDGRWMPAWTWGDDPHWPQARLEWADALTAQSLITLDAYGRIEER